MQAGSGWSERIAGQSGRWSPDISSLPSVLLAMRNLMRILICVGTRDEPAASPVASYTQAMDKSMSLGLPHCRACMR